MSWARAKLEADVEWLLRQLAHILNGHSWETFDGQLTAQRLGNDLCRIETGGFHVLKFLKRELICKGNISYMNTFAIAKIEGGYIAGRISRQHRKSLIIILLNWLSDAKDLGPNGAPEVASPVKTRLLTDSWR